MSIPGTIFQPNSSTDFSTGITYVGPTISGLTLQSQYSLDTDEFGVTNLRRKWKLERKYKIANYLPQKGNVDFQYPQLQVFDFTVEGDGAYETLTVHYNGFLKKPGAPLVRESSARQIREATIYATTQTPVQQVFGNLTMIYVAPTLTRRYATLDEPELQSPYSVKGFDEPILRLGFKGGNGVEIQGATIDFLTQYFRYDERPVRMDFQVDHEGAVYRVTEVIEMTVVQIAHVNLDLTKL